MTIMIKTPKKGGQRPFSIFDSRAVITPGTIVRLSRADKKTPAWEEDVGRQFMVGFYSKEDGLDCIFLVNEDGVYEQTTDHEFLFRYFTIAKPSLITDFYGFKHEKLPMWPKKFRGTGPTMAATKSA